MVTRQTLIDLDLLDASIDAQYDLVTQAISKVFNCRSALFSIIDYEADRQYFKSHEGLSDAVREARQTALTHSFCKTVVAEDSLVRVQDARVDARFSNNPAIEDLGVVGYIGAPVRADDGDPIGALCVFEDTPRNWSERDAIILAAFADSLSHLIALKSSLQEQEKLRSESKATSALLEEVAANVPGAIFRYTIDTDGSDQVHYMSPGCLDVWEVPPQEIEKDPSKLWEVIVENDVAGMQASIARSARTLEPWEHRWSIVTRSGARKTLQGHGRPQRDPDGSTTWTSVIFDVSVEVAAQERLRRQDERLVEAQKQELVGNVAAGVAHDFNNILAIIMGNAEMLGLTKDRDELKVNANEIISAVEHGSELTNSLLSFAKRSTFDKSTLAPNEIISELIPLLSSAIPENIHLKWAPRDALPNIRVDKTQLERALLNLVMNAKDAMPTGGNLTIETQSLEVDDDFVAERGEDIEPGIYTLIAVTDTGVGISEELQDRIFEPFFSTRGSDGGTGLGLSMVYGFAKQSKGTVRVYSEVGRGTSIQILLPSSNKTMLDGARSERAFPGTGLEGVRILLAEDNDGVRRVVARALSAVGVDVLEASSGDEALAILDGDYSAVDLILSDIVMPGNHQGPDLVREIRKYRPEMKVIYMSGYPHEANVHGNGLRSDDVTLMKPIQIAKLTTAITERLGA